jgi:hypothetical protein
MTKKEIRSWYDSLSDDERMSYLRKFDDVAYDKLGSHEIKFFRWLKTVKPKRKYTKKLKT